MGDFPRFYGGSVDLETGEVYDARQGPPGARLQDPKVRAKAKAARKARKKNRRKDR
jgi:hypothetical protein